MLDVVATVIGRDCANLREVGNHNWMIAPELVAFIAFSAGIFRIETPSLEPKARINAFEQGGE